MTAENARVSQPHDYKLIVEKDVQIPLRDGTILFADVFRPDADGERFPAIMSLTIYQKDKVWLPRQISGVFSRELLSGPRRCSGRPSSARWE